MGYTLSRTRSQATFGAGLSLYSVDAAAIDLSRPKGRGRVSKAARAGMLFTHRGFSGPALLDLSHHAIMAIERSTPKPGKPHSGAVQWLSPPLSFACRPLPATVCHTLQLPFAPCPLLWPAALCCGQLAFVASCPMPDCAAMMPFVVVSYPLLWAAGKGQLTLCRDQLPFVVISCHSSAALLHAALCKATLSGGQLPLRLPCACCQFTNISSSLCAGPFAVFSCLLHAALCELHLPFYMLLWGPPRYCGITYSCLKRIGRCCCLQIGRHTVPWHSG